MNDQQMNRFQNQNVQNQDLLNPEQSAPRAPAARPSLFRRAKGWTARRAAALALCCALAGGVLGAGAMAYSGGETVLKEGRRTAAKINTVQVDTSRQMTPAEVYAANVNSTVGITTSITTTNYWGYTTTNAAAGSGFILTKDGYILTNYHVIEGGSSIAVTLYDGSAYEAELVGFDESNDIAVLKVEAQDLTPVVLGDSDSLLVGDSVIAIGNPLGELTFSLTAGIVSALNREVTLSSTVTMNLIQTDCAINSGNSGGALFNLHGEVIGITNAKYSGNGMSEASIDNIGFAIPMNSVRSIVESIIESGVIDKPYIGVTASNVGAESQAYGLPKGAAIQSVTAGGPAEKAGLQVNDIVTAVNGKAISGSQALVSAVTRAKEHDALKLTVYRQGETLELTVTVAVRRQSALPEAKETEKSQASPRQSSQNLFPGFFGWYR